MIEFHDPFQVNSDRYKELLDQDSPSKYTPFEEIKDGETILNENTTPGLPPGAFKAIQERLQANEEDKKRVAEMFNKLIVDLNNKYGLSVQFDFDSFSNSLQYIIEPNQKKAMEYYLSEAYSRVRVMLYQKYLQAIVMLSEQILNPQYILSDSMTYAEKLEIVKQLYEFMRTMNDIYKEVNIPNTELKLEKLSEDTNSVHTDIDDPNVRKFLAGLAGSFKKKD